MIRHQDKIYTLEQFSNVMCSLVNQKGLEVLQPLQYHDSGLRITVINPDGKVMFDSERNPAQLENHLQRKEVIEAIRTGKGSSNRYSSTLEQQTYYQAMRLENQDILRISFVTDSILSYTIRMTAYFIVLLLFIILASSLIARRLTKYLMEPFDKIDLNRPLKFDTYEELLPFLCRISEQQNKIDEQIAELSRKNNELQVIIKSMSDGLVLLNSRGIILTINKIARKIFGVTKEDCLNQNYLSIDHSQYMQDLMANQSQKPRQTMQITKDDRDYEIRFNRIEDNQKCLGFAMVILDVTEKARSEQMRQEFTANVSHELKTPLQSIIGYSELMANGLVRADDIRPFAERIHRQSTRLQSLIEDIIFLSSLDEGQSGLTEQISVAQITREIFDNLQEKANENHVSLKIEGKDLIFVAVNRYIYELIYNLVDNAIRYNKPQGSVTVSLKESNNKYQIEVSDTGIGVSQADQFRIFERFYRVDKSHSRKTGGTGLGLSIVKRVVMFHKGKIKVQSTLGKGTTFIITFNKDKLEQVIAENQQKQQQMLENIHKEAQATEDGVTIGGDSSDSITNEAPSELNDSSELSISNTLNDPSTQSNSSELNVPPASNHAASYSAQVMNNDAEQADDSKQTITHAVDSEHNSTLKQIASAEQSLVSATNNVQAQVLADSDVVFDSNQAENLQDKDVSIAAAYPESSSKSAHSALATMTTKQRAESKALNDTKEINDSPALNDTKEINDIQRIDDIVDKYPAQDADQVALNNQTETETLQPVSVIPAPAPDSDSKQANSLETNTSLSQDFDGKPSTSKSNQAVKSNTDAKSASKTRRRKTSSAESITYDSDTTTTSAALKTRSKSQTSRTKTKASKSTSSKISTAKSTTSKAKVVKSTSSKTSKQRSVKKDDSQG